MIFTYDIICVVINIITIALIVLSKNKQRKNIHYMYRNDFCIDY